MPHVKLLLDRDGHLTRGDVGTTIFTYLERIQISVRETRKNIKRSRRAIILSNVHQRIIRATIDASVIRASQPSMYVLNGMYVCTYIQSASALEPHPQRLIIHPDVRATVD